MTVVNMVAHMVSLSCKYKNPSKGQHFGHVQNMSEIWFGNIQGNGMIIGLLMMAIGHNFLSIMNTNDMCM